MEEWAILSAALWGWGHKGECTDPAKWAWWADCGGLVIPQEEGKWEEIQTLHKLYVGFEPSGWLRNFKLWNQIKVALNV